MQRVARLLFLVMVVSGRAEAARGDVWLRCVLTETATSSGPGAVTAAPEEQLDRVYIYVFNARRDSLLRYEAGQLRNLNGLGLFDGVNRTGSVVVTPLEITYNYSVAPHSGEFSQVIDRTTLAIEERGTSFRDPGSPPGTPAARSWVGTGQCQKIRPEPIRRRQI